MKHWTEDDFIDWLYAGESPSGHLDECDLCRARAGEMSAAKRQAINPPEVSWEFLAAQRRSIYRRMGAGALQKGYAVATRWAVACAGLAGIVALSVTMLQPSHKSDLYTSSDAKLFSDLAAIEQSSEPRTIQPIHNLFQEKPVSE